MSDQPIDGTRWTRYIWLVYLAALLFQPLLDPGTGPVEWLALIVMVALFLPVYFATFRAQDDRRRLWLIGALAALGLVGSIFNAAAPVFVIYAAAAAARLEPVRRAVLVIVGLVAVIGVAFVISPIPLQWRLAGFAPALVFTVVTGVAGVFEAERDRGNRRLLRADEEIERLARLAERERIGRDLHDLLGHTLSVIVLKSELAGRLLDADLPRAASEIREIEQIGRDALGEVRAAVLGYRSRGLEEELDGARRALAAADVGVEVDADVPELPADLESALALALREAVTNVVRHADARGAVISIRRDEGLVVLEVADDGRGNDLPEGAGLSGMRERIAALGGDVEVSGEAGTRVRVRLPLPAPGR